MVIGDGRHVVMGMSVTRNSVTFQQQQTSKDSDQKWPKDNQDVANISKIPW
jgi:hypothetical protein